MMEEEGFVDDTEDPLAKAGSYITELNKLTGLPLPSDVIMFCVPVCGPYQSLQRYKYKVKLTPGSTKKGRAGKQALDVFTRMKECSPRERDLIKFVSDNELVQTIIGEVKVSTPGLHAAFNAKRSTKKAGKNKSQ
uniref:NFACT protein C-terminal domain-containing protein n=1 Tax=Octactis speculum TaxID=3111310 RepID=A0A7S2HPI5_9STRA